MTEENKPLFRQLDADEADQEVTKVESLCMECLKNGTTQIMLTKIPQFNEVVLMSFHCEHCGFENNEIQPGGAVAEKGVRVTLKAAIAEDLNRRVVRSDHTTVKFPELDFEITAQNQKGGVTTVEGVIERSVRGLQQDQPLRMQQHPEAAENIEIFICRLQKLTEMSEPFTVVLEDISGNSHIENPYDPLKDPRCTVQHFKRTQEQDHKLGIYTKQEITGEANDGIMRRVQDSDFTLEDLQSEVLMFPTNCHNCRSPCDTNMKVTNIPHFKDVIIMATVCDVCGHRTNEVKSGGGIEPQGLRIEVDVKGKEDFSRDVLKSETCSLSIPELELEVGPAALGGRFTTVEGLLVAVKNQLSDGHQTHLGADSESGERKNRFAAFIERLEEVLAAKFSITLVLDDPAGNSYVQSMAEDEDADDRLRITRYERTYEQNEELGLNDMKTENYA